MAKRHETPIKRTNPSGRAVWVARYTDASGERKSAGTYPTKGAAQDAINAAYDAPVGAGTTLGEYASTWTQRHPRSARTNDTNDHRIGRILDVKVEGRKLRDWPLGEIRPRHMYDLVGVLLTDQKRSASGARNILRSLSALFKDAWKRDEIPGVEMNPVAGIEIRANDPRCVKFPKAKRVFTFDQMHAFATAAREAAWTRPDDPKSPAVNPHMATTADAVELLILMYADSGMRLAEGLAIFRTDLQQGMWTVQRTLHEGTVMQGTKTTHGRMDIAPRRTVATQRQLDLLLRIPPRIDTPFLFLSSKGRMWSERNFHTYVWEPTRKVTGLDCTPQEFRASWESNLRAAGCDASDLAEMAGHSLETADRHYVRALGQSYDAVREAIGG